MRHVLSVLTVLLFTTTTGRPRHQSDLTDAGKKSRPEEDGENVTPAKRALTVSHSQRPGLINITASSTRI